MARVGQQRPSRPQLRRKLRELIDHPNTEPVIRAEARRKYQYFFPQDDLSEPPPDETKAFVVIGRRRYAHPSLLWHQPFVASSDRFRPRIVTYNDVMQAAAGAEFVEFYRLRRVVIVQYRKLISDETLAARFASHGLDCPVRHLGGFSQDCQYRVDF